MPTLDELIHKDVAPPPAVRAKVAVAPTHRGDPLFITVDAFDGGRQQWGPCEWVPSDALPLRGDDCLVVFDERDVPWVMVTTSPGAADIRDHGAVGSQVGGLGRASTTLHDDTQAIQDAIDAAYKSGQRVSVPSGVYAISHSLVLRRGVRLVGDHYATSRIILMPGEPNVDMIVSDGSVSDRCRDISIERLTVDGNKAAQDPSHWTTCLHLEHVDNPRVVDCQIINSLIDGAYLYDCDSARIIRCLCNDNGYPRADASGMNLDTCRRAQVLGCVTDRNGFHGINLANTSDSVFADHWAADNGWDGSRVDWSSARNHYVRFNAQRNFRGIYFLNDSTLNRVEHSTFRSNQTNGVLFASVSGHVVAFNYMEGNGEYAVATVNGDEHNYGWGNSYRGNALGTELIVTGASFDPAQGTGYAI